MIEELDNTQLHFDQDGLFVLNLTLAIIMFGVALSLRFQDFKYVLQSPKSFFVGLASQFLWLPFLTFILVLLIQPAPSVALGLFLVAACPGGNISNFLTLLARGNTALSVSLTAFSTVFSIILTPLNFSFWSARYSPAAQLLQEISLDYMDVFKTVAMILGIPLLVGMFINHKWPTLAKKLSNLLKPISIGIFVIFIVIAFYANYDHFLQFILLIFFWVFLHNFLALTGGFLLAKLFGSNEADTKTITIETGIQNSGLALVLIFTYFEGLGGMAIIAGWWGIWHIIAGLSVAFSWKMASQKKKVNMPV
jgi:BASS family bile acid:Na+ symporter